eukprot:9498999-Pyramimonas_sp.AAC.1
MTELTWGAERLRPRRKAVAELELVAKELHPEQREDEHEEQQDEAQVRDVHQTLEDGADDVVQLFPRPGQLEHAQQPEGA